MSLINGKYLPVSQDGLKEMFAKLGKHAGSIETELTNSSFEFKVDGKKIIQSHTFGYRHNVIMEFIVGQETEQKFSATKSLKCTAKLDGNVLEIDSIDHEGKKYTKIYNFLETGLQVDLVTPEGNFLIDYKRV